MNAYNEINRRREAGAWITRWAAESADVRTLGDLVAMCACYALVALLAWQVAA